MNYLPSVVKIGPHEYEVKRVENVIINGSADYGGSQDEMDLTIKILKDMKPTIQESVLTHEIIHALIDLTGIRGDALPEGIDVEELTERLTTPLYMFLKDNTNFFEPKEKTFAEHG